MKLKFGIMTIQKLGQQKKAESHGGYCQMCVNAKLFRRWVTHEVLPEIHRTGKYSRCV